MTTENAPMAMRWSKLESRLQKDGDLAPTPKQLQAYKTVYYGGVAAAITYVAGVLQSNDTVETKAEALRRVQDEILNYFKPSN